MIWPFGTDPSPPLSDLERQMREMDWARTPVGPVASWPQSLKMSVRVLLDCQLPMYLCWGPEYTQFYNDAYRRILGNKHAHALGGDARITWAEIWSIKGPMWKRVLAGHPVGFDDFKLTIDRYGYFEECYFNFSYSPVANDDGQNAGVLVTFVETTEKVQATRRRAFLLQLADAIRGLAAAADISTLAAQQIGIYLGVDHAGYGELAQAGLERFDRQLIEHLKAGRTLALDDIATDPRTAHVEQDDIRALLVAPLIKSGRLVSVLYLHARAPRHWSGEDIALAEDVAERTWDAIERARAQDALHSADRRKDEFLAMLAHELRNPLAPIYSAAQLLRTGKLNATRIQETSKLIERQVDHMRKLVDDLIEVSRVTRGLVELDHADVDLHAVIDTAVEQVRPLLNARGHHLVLRLPSEPVILRGDRVRLIQVISNLLNNAAKYTIDAGTIGISVRGGHEEVEIVVEDDGPGIGPELLPNVFGLFVQGRRLPDRPQGGLGLGLALVKTLVELHKGSVSAWSDGSNGSRFTVQLPWSRPHTAPVPCTEAPIAAPVTGLQIMLVDDNQDAALMLSMLLEAQGHTLAVAHDGGSALALAQEFKPQALILDIGLPDMDGFQLARRLRQGSGLHDACFIALTGYGQAGDRLQSQAAGFDYHLTKPANHLELARVLSGIQAV
jgi:signal transduction histidine kinase